MMCYKITYIENHDSQEYFCCTSSRKLLFDEVLDLIGDSSDCLLMSIDRIYVADLDSASRPFCSKD